VTDYDKIIQEMEAEDRARRARSAGIAAPEGGPDKAAAAIKLGETYGVPPGAAIDMLPDLQQRERLDRIDRVSGTSKPLAHWLGRPENAALADDDLDVLDKIGRRFNDGLLALNRRAPWVPLTDGAEARQAEIDSVRAQGPAMMAAPGPSWFEELVGKFESGWYKGRAGMALLVDPINPVKVTSDSVAQGLGYRDAAEYNRRALGQSIAGEMRTAGAANRESAATAAGFAEIAEADESGSTMDVVMAAATNPRAVMAVVAESLGTTAPNLALSAAMPASRAVAAITAGAGSFSTEQGMTVLDVMGEDGVDTENGAQVIAFLGDRKKMEAARDRALKRGVAVATFDALTAGLAGRLVSNSRRSIVSVGSRVAGEAGIQAGGGAAGEATAQLASEGRISSRADIVLEAAAEMPTFLAEGRGQIMEARRAAAINEERAAARAERDTLSELVGLAGESRTRQRAPGRFESLIRDMTEEGTDTVYIPAEAARTLYQSAEADGMDIGQLIDPDGLREALVTGGEVAVPLARYVATITPAQHAMVAEAVRLQPGGLQDMPAVSQEEIQQAIADGLAEAQANEERDNGAAGRVYDDIYGQLLTKMDEKTARQSASVVQSVYRNLGERVGMDAWALYEQFQVNIVGAKNDTRAKPRGVDIDVDPLLDALRTGKLPTDREIFGDSFVSALHAAGGLRDSGGELANMDAAKARPGLVNNLAGMTLDDAVAWAYQEGFLSEAPTQLRTNEDGTPAGYSDSAPDINTILDMLARDLGGEPVYRANATNVERAKFREDALALQEELDARGIDLQKMDNATVRSELGFTSRELAQSGIEAFTATTPAGTFTLTDAAVAGGIREVLAYDGEDQIGSLLYSSDGTPPTVDVAESHRRRGVGTAMLKLAKQQGGVLGDADTGMPGVGTRYRTEDGQAFRAGADESRVVLERANRTLYQGAKVTDTAEFKKWFGESKVVDANGEPLVVYHGTDSPQFEVFDRAKGGSGPSKFGFWFTNQETFAELFGGNMMPVYIKAENPKRITLENWNQIRDKHAKDGEWFNRWRDELIAQGHDGLIVAGGTDQVGKFTVQNPDVLAVFEPTQIKSATANRGTFDPENPSILMQEGGKNPRGKVTFNDGENGRRQFDIELLKGMDSSTFMHEMGHVYLEVLNDLASRDGAPAQVVNDMATLNAWLGREDGASITTEQHEQFARGFEAYLREGRAPSSALRRAFAAFKVWLTAIYRDVRRLRVELTDDVRGVMDRIVASDAEIAEARGGMYHEALISDALAVGMTPAQFEAYNTAVSDAQADAEAAVAAETLSALQRESRAWYVQEKRKVREEVAAELRGTPVYRAARLLRTGKLPTGELAPDVLRVKLSKDDLLDQFGQSFLRNLVGMYTVEGGVRADEAAALYGFGSGRELVAALVNAPRLADAIASETDARMANRYPDPMTDGSLPDRAMLAVHRDRQADVMLREIAILERATGRRATPGGVIKAQAQAIIAGKKLRHLQPATYRAAEVKAGREAFEAASRQDWPAALAARRRQLLNFELFRSAVRARNEAVAAARYLAKFSEKKQRARLGKLGGDYLDQVDALLDRFDFRKISDKAADRRASLTSWVKAQAERGIDINLPEKLLDEAFRVPYRELTYRELLDVRDAIRSIDHLARLKGKLLLGEEVRDAAEVDAAMAASLRAAHEARPETTGDRLRSDEVRRAFQQGRVLQAAATDLTRELDGFVDVGAIWTNTVGVIRHAVYNMVNPKLQEAQDALATIYAAHYTKDEIRRFSDRVPVPEVNGDLWSKSRILALALNWGNEGNREAILTQGRGRISAEQAGALLSRLDSRDWRFVESVWKLIDSQWPAIAAAQKRRTGLVPDRVQASPFTVQTSDGKTLQIPGGYYPLKYEADSVRTMKEEADDFYNSIRTGRSARAATRNGHTIERVGSGGRTVRLDTGVIQTHLRDVIRDVYMGDAVNYVHNVINGAEFRAAIDKTGMQEYRQALEVWLKDAASGEIGPRVWHERAMRSVRQNFTASVLTWKFVSAALQVTGVVQTGVVVGHANTAASIAQYLRRPVAMTRYVRGASPYMESRMRTHLEAVQMVMDAEAGRFEAGRAAMIRWGYWMIGRVQSIVDAITWMSAEAKGMEMFGGDVVRARAYADDVVSRAQGSGEFIDKNPLQRGTLGDNVRQSEWIKATTTLMGYMMAKGNAAYEVTQKTNFRSPRQVLKWMSDLVLLFTVEGLLVNAIRGGLPGDDDDDGSIIDDMAEFIVVDTLSTFFGTVPGLSTMVSEFRGYDSGGVMANAWAAYAGLAKQLQPNSDGEVEMDKAVVKSAVKAAGVTFGVPSSQANKTIDAIAAGADGRDVSPYEYLTGPKKE
jgi:hypothetical protein